MQHDMPEPAVEVADGFSAGLLAATIGGFILGLLVTAGLAWLVAAFVL